MTESAAGRHWRPWALALALLLGAIAVWRWFASGAPGGGDGTQYLAHALALAEGRPYGDIGYLYSPYAWFVGPPLFPPGLPLTLAPLLILFGTGLTAPRLLMHALLLCFAVLVGRYFSRQSGPILGWASGAMVAASFLLFDRPNVVGSDLGFCALVWAVLNLADGSEEWSRRRTAGIAALGCGALLYRVAGAPLVPAALLLAASRRGKPRRQAALTAAIWAVTLFVVATRFGIEYSPASASTSDGATGGVAWLLSHLQGSFTRLDAKAISYRQALSEAFLYPLPFKPGNNVYHVGALLLAVVGLGHWLRTQRRLRTSSFGVLFALMTVVMLAWLRVWDARYLWVVTPFFCYGLLVSVQGIAAGWRRSNTTAKSATGMLPGNIAAGIALTLVALASLTLLIQPRPVLPDEQENWSEVSILLREVSGSSEMRLASNRPRKVSWFTGVPAMPVTRMDLHTFLQEAERQRLTHAVMTGAALGGSELERWEAWGRERPGLMKLLSVSGPVRIYELDLSAGR